MAGFPVWVLLVRIHGRIVPFRFYVKSLRLNEGDLIFVDPESPLKAGDAVVVQTQDYEGADVLSWLKEYVRQSREDLTTRQHNLPAEVKFKLAVVRAVHRVMTTKDLFGL